jgi:rhamnulose-1-phosphate aldolase
VHEDEVQRTGTNFHAVIHAQPLHLTYLSHLPAYASTRDLSRQLLRWQPELIVHLPEGIGVIPFVMPGSRALQEATVHALKTHRVVVWSKHGAMAKSDVSVLRAADRIEYAETAAHYEYLDLTAGGLGTGLTDEELLAIAAEFGVEQCVV